MKQVLIADALRPPRGRSAEGGMVSITRSQTLKVLAPLSRWAFHRAQRMADARPAIRIAEGLTSSPQICTKPEIGCTSGGAVTTAEGGTTTTVAGAGAVAIR